MYYWHKLSPRLFFVCPGFSSFDRDKPTSSLQIVRHLNSQPRTMPDPPKKPIARAIGWVTAIHNQVGCRKRKCGQHISGYSGLPFPSFEQVRSQLTPCSQQNLSSTWVKRKETVKYSVEILEDCWTVTLVPSANLNRQISCSESRFDTAGPNRRFRIDEFPLNSTSDLSNLSST